jgi:hypothetical protein
MHGDRSYWKSQFSKWCLAEMIEYHFGFLGPVVQYPAVELRREFKLEISNSFKFFMINYKYRHDLA